MLTFGLTVNAVHNGRSRVMQRLREEVGRAIEREEHGVDAVDDDDA